MSVMRRVFPITVFTAPFRWPISCDQTADRPPANVKSTRLRDRSVDESTPIGRRRNSSGGGVECEPCCGRYRIVVGGPRGTRGDPRFRHLGRFGSGLEQNRTSGATGTTVQVGSARTCFRFAHPGRESREAVLKRLATVMSNCVGVTTWRSWSSVGLAAGFA
jgi:hypothetical protein